MSSRGHFPNLPTNRYCTNLSWKRKSLKQIAPVLSSVNFCSGLTKLAALTRHLENIKLDYDSVACAGLRLSQFTDQVQIEGLKNCTKLVLEQREETD